MATLSSSQPVYRSLQADPLGCTHLLIAQALSATDALTCAEQMVPLQARLSIWTLGGIAPPVPDVAVTGFADAASLLQALHGYLQAAPMGLRLYAIGAEPMLCRIAAQAAAFDLLPPALQLQQAGAARRRVYGLCCRQWTETTTAGRVTCGSCGSALDVRDHFSRRLAAYMGVLARSAHDGSDGRQMECSG